VQPRCARVQSISPCLQNFWSRTEFRFSCLLVPASDTKSVANAPTLKALCVVADVNKRARQELMCDLRSVSARPLSKDSVLELTSAISPTFAPATIARLNHHLRHHRTPQPSPPPPSHASTIASATIARLNHRHRHHRTPQPSPPPPSHASTIASATIARLNHRPRHHRTPQPSPPPPSHASTIDNQHSYLINHTLCLCF
jgi:hypothetical protein